MTSKERVIAAINGEKTDRIPIFMWYSGKTIMRLAKHLGIAEDKVECTLGNDIYQDWLSINREMNTPCRDGETFVDEWGIAWKRDGEYNTTVKHPFAKLDAGGLKAARLPDPDDPKRYAKMKAMIAGNKGNYFIGADVSGTIFEPSYHLRGMDNVLVDMVTESEEAEILFDKLMNFSLRVALNAQAMGADWIWLGDDFGTQVNMMASPEIWRAQLKPRYKKIVVALKTKNSNVTVAFHSCGSVYPILGDLLEIGIKVINPLQESARGIDHEKIRAEFPEATMFCGLDTQQYLANADPKDVYEKAVQKIEILSKNGRYIFGVSHTIQHDVPCENILAMLNAAGIAL